MKNRNRNQNAITENQTIILKPIVPHPEPAAIGELLTLTEIEDVIKTHVVLSEAAATALVVRKRREGDLN